MMLTVTLHPVGNPLQSRQLAAVQGCVAPSQDIHGTCVMLCDVSQCPSLSSFPHLCCSSTSAGAARRLFLDASTDLRSQGRGHERSANIRVLPSVRRREEDHAGAGHQGCAT